VVRIPEKYESQLMTLAHRLDESGAFELHEDSETLVFEFYKPSNIKYNLSRPINVASVPQRSPFRYPGGKTWLIPHIRSWLRNYKKVPSRLIEPFAGGAIVSLTAAFEGLARHVIFAELDSGVAAVWRVVLNGQAEWLANEIKHFDLTVEKARMVLGQPAETLREKAFQTILRNRVQRGGIMAPGAGLVKTGENGRGVNSRWYPDTLASRIREINKFKEHLTFVEGDAFALIEEHAQDKESVFYIDPPYTVAAKRLYSQWQVNHRQLFELLSKCKGDFLMSYDNTEEIAELAKEFEFNTRSVAMKNTHHAKMTELLIGRNLDWVD